MYADGTFGELVLSEEEEKGQRRVSFKPDATVDDIDAAFLSDADAVSKGRGAGGIDDLFHEGAAEYSGLELHETDEEKEAAALSDDLFESGTETGDQGDED